MVQLGHGMDFRLTLRVRVCKWLPPLRRKSQNKKANSACSEEELLIESTMRREIQNVVRQTAWNLTASKITLESMPSFGEYD